MNFNEFDFSKSNLIFENSLLKSNIKALNDIYNNSNNNNINKKSKDDKNINYLMNGGKFGFNLTTKNNLSNNYNNNKTTTSSSTSTSPVSSLTSPIQFGKIKALKERRHRRLTANSVICDKKHSSKCSKLFNY